MQSKFSLPFFLLLAAGLWGSTPALANRCEWHQVMNRAQCCKADEQAIWNGLFRRVECVKSVSGDSCVWDNLFNRIRCCETEEHAVWNPQLNRLMCHRF